MSDHRVLASGIGFTEGPVWTSGGRLLVTSMSRGLLVEVDLDGGGPGATVEVGGGPNGLAQDDRGRLWVAQNGATIVASRSERAVRPGLQSVDDDEVTDAPTPAELRAPNDLVQGPDGRIWFTDPGPPGDPEPGRVWVHDPASGATTVVVEGIAYPNGLAFTADGATLLVADTETARILALDLDGTPRGVFAELPDGGPDGIAFAADGTLYAAVPGADAVAVLDPDGAARPSLRLEEGTFPTNVCFAGAGLDVLVVTAARGGRVLALDGIARGREV